MEKSLLRLLVEKWSCNHKWNLYKEMTIYGSDRSIPKGIDHTMLCEKCGKFKKISL